MFFFHHKHPTTTKKIYQIIGWFGTVAIIVAYFANIMDILDVHSFWYRGLNIVGAAAIVLVAYIKRDFQPMVLNIVWVLIGVISFMGF